MTTLDLRREAKKHPLVLDGLDRIPDEERQVALENWRDRVASEYASARVFAALVPQLMRAGASHGQIAKVADMIGQEMNHGILCARVVMALGRDAEADFPDLRDVPAHDDVAPVEAVLRNVISVGVLQRDRGRGAGRDRTRAGGRAGAARGARSDPLGRGETRAVRLEARGRAAPTLDTKARERLGAYLVAVFEHQITFHAPFLRWPSVSDRAISIGAVDGPLNWQIFVETIQGVTIPGLERYGLPAQRAWQAAVASVGVS